MQHDSLRSDLDFAVEMAWRAGRITLSHFQTGVAVESKEDHSPVTVADREAERSCRESILRVYPDDGILGEEYGLTNPEARRRWVLDPIDGTKSFVRGVPFYGVLIALEEDGIPEVGVIHFPALDETVSAARGAGCWWNGRRARVSEISKLSEAALLSTTGRWDGQEGWDRLTTRAGLVRTWGDCYGHALVATGRAEVMVDFVAAPWDAAALRPILEEAGGVFSDLSGNATHNGGSALSTNAALAEEVRRMLRTGATTA